MPCSVNMGGAVKEAVPPLPLETPLAAIWGSGSLPAVAEEATVTEAMEQEQVFAAGVLLPPRGNDAVFDGHPVEAS